MFAHIRKTFYNLSVRSKFVILFYSGIALMFLMLTLLLLTLAEHNARQDVWAMASKSVSYTNLIVEKEQQYLLGIASYYAIASEVQDLLRASNNGEVSNRLPENLLAVSQSRQYVLSVAFYNKYGENVDYFTIDGSYGAVDQDPTDPSRPIYTLLQGKKAIRGSTLKKMTLYTLCTTIRQRFVCGMQSRIPEPGSPLVSCPSHWIPASSFLWTAFLRKPATMC